MPTPADPNPGQPEPADPERLEPISPQEIAALTAAGILDAAADDDVPVGGWRVPGLGQTPASGIAAFDGLTPPLAALLVSRYSRPGQLVLDLTSDLAVEGVAGAGDRRYTAVHPAAAVVLACARQRGTWPPAALLLVRWPRHLAAEPGWAPDLPELLRECRDLLAPDGYLIAVVGLGDAEPGARLKDVIGAAARARLHIDQRHVILTAPAPPSPGSRPAAAPSSSTRHVDLLVFARADADD
jgi:hypothetical protein